MRVKINCVALNECNESQWGKLAALAKEYPMDVRFIEMMPIGLGKAYQGSMQEVIPVSYTHLSDQRIVFVYPGLSDDGSFPENNIPFA